MKRPGFLEGKPHFPERGHCKGRRPSPLPTVVDQGSSQKHSFLQRMAGGAWPKGPKKGLANGTLNNPCPRGVVSPQRNRWNVHEFGAPGIRHPSPPGSSRTRNFQKIGGPGKIHYFRPGNHRAGRPEPGPVAGRATGRGFVKNVFVKKTFQRNPRSGVC